MIRLIALDLDGTTLRSDGSLSGRTRQALRAAMDQGVHVVVASGRSFHSLPTCLRRYRDLNMPSAPTGRR